jgi:hypothetical protein
MASETKSDLVEELSSQSTKADLVELLGSRLKKDEISKLLDDDSGGTKDELLRKLGSRTKDELVQAVESKLTKEQIEKAVDAVRDDSGDEEDADDRGSSRRQRDQGQQEARQRDEQRNEEQDDERGDEQDEGPQRTRRADDTELEWNTELEWSPAPRPTPAPVAFAGAPPFLPGARVRVDLSGLPTMGVFLGKGASAAGTIVGVNARERSVRVYLDACFDGEKEILLPPERVVLDR